MITLTALLALGFALIHIFIGKLRFPGAVTPLPEFAIGLLFALLAGGVVLNVLKEELPEERQSRFLPFLGGAAGYAALLLVI